MTELRDPRSPAPHIVVGVDGSAEADRALAWALDEAQRRQGVIDLVAVYTLPMVSAVGMAGGYPVMSAEEIRDVEARHAHMLAERAERAATSHPTVSVAPALVQGAAVPVLLDRAADADLIVLGTHGAGAFERLVLGSVAHSVAHRAKCPVVLVPDSSAAAGPHRVVVGIDGSEHSDFALEWAASMAAECGVELVIVHAWEHPYRFEGDGAYEAMRIDAAALLDEEVRRAKVHSGGAVNASGVLVEGSAADALSNEAGPGDLLVVGARGRGVWRAALLGSVSATVINQANGPVAVVRMK